MNPETTRYYHCMSRCVRRAFLMGEDAATGKSYEHRKAWVEEELARLCQVFAIDCCAYAVMSNHVHSVLRIAVERAAEWSDAEVMERASALWPLAVARLKQTNRWDEKREEYRERLASLSWFMRQLNERIARRANREDGVKGRFWEGRFRSRPILDQAALLTCMAYVDLNPVRAGLAASLGESDFTSIQARLFEHGETVAVQAVESVPPAATVDTADVRDESGGRGRSSDPTPVPLMPFVNQQEEGADANDAVPMHFGDYVELVRFTGQAMLRGKGSLPSELGALLRGIGLSDSAWLRTIAEFPEERFAALGECDLIRAYAEGRGKQRAHGVGYARLAYAA